jgi:hypothetical protein
MPNTVAKPLRTNRAPHVDGFRRYLLRRRLADAAEAGARRHDAARVDLATATLSGVRAAQAYAMLAGASGALTILVVLACACSKKSTSEPAVAMRDEPDAATPAAASRSDAELPLGHWEDGVGADKMCLTLLPYGGIRFAVRAEGMRKPARVTGRIVAAAEKDGRYELTMEVMAIVAKEIGRCREAWVDYNLDDAIILGARVGSPKSDAGTARARFSLRFEPGEAKVEVCNLDGEARCRRLAKARSPTDADVGIADRECNSDADCLPIALGEMCTPCPCANAAYVKDKRQEILERAERASRECGPTPRVTCPACAPRRAACRASRCVLVDASDGR